MSPNHWTARGFLVLELFLKVFIVVNGKTFKKVHLEAKIS